MATTSAVVKKTAKAVLKNNWTEAVAISAIFIFSVFVSYIALSLFDMVVNNVVTVFVTVLIQIFVILPLLLGCFRCFWLMMCDQKNVLSEVFYYYSSAQNYFKSVKLFGSMILKILWIAVLLFIPSVITDILSSTKLYDFFQLTAPAWTSNFSVVSVFLKTVAGVILLLLMVKYYLAPFLIIADEQMDVQEAIHKSTLLSKATGMDFILLILSFFGWIVASVFVIPLLVALPLFMVSYMVHSRFSVANYNKIVARLGVNEEKTHYINEGF